MHRFGQLARRRSLDIFLVLLAAAQVISVLTGPGPHKPTAALISALSVLVLLAHRRQPFVASLTAFANMALVSALSPTTTLVQFFGLLTTFAVVGAVNRPREAVVAWLLGSAVVC